MYDLVSLNERDKEITTYEHQQEDTNKNGNKSTHRPIVKREQIKYKDVEKQARGNEKKLTTKEYQWMYTNPMKLTSIQN